MIRFFEVTAPLFAIGGGITAWSADGRWWVVLPGLLAMSWGLAWLQARR